MSTAEYSLAETLMDIRGVSLTLGGRLILKDVTASIKNIVRPPPHTQGQVVGFLGPSGIGKTQLFRILAGLNKPTTGEVLVTENLVPVQAGMVGVVAQHYPLFGHRTVFGNLMLAGRLAGLDRSAANERASKLLARFGLDDRAEAWPAELSGGQRQRVAIMQQLMGSDHFLLMDEPFSGLDPIMKDEACKLITEVAAMHELTTIIVVTHDIGSAIQVSDTLWLMGRDRDAEGKAIPGARIKATHDLIGRGLAWREDITAMPEFAECVREVHAAFKSL
jgi:polar amino acid transport system ATP-binding protein/sulfate transport system ATP-binding protein